MLVQRPPRVARAVVVPVVLVVVAALPDDAVAGTMQLTIPDIVPELATCESSEDLHQHFWW